MSNDNQIEYHGLHDGERYQFTEEDVIYIANRLAISREEAIDELHREHGDRAPVLMSMVD